MEFVFVSPHHCQLLVGFLLELQAGEIVRQYVRDCLWEYYSARGVHHYLGNRWFNLLVDGVSADDGTCSYRRPTRAFSRILARWSEWLDDRLAVVSEFPLSGRI